MGMLWGGSPLTWRCRGWLTLPLPRLLQSLTNLKRIIINAAHYLVLGDKDTYRHDPAAPFLGMVSSTSPCLPALAHCPHAPGSNSVLQRPGRELQIVPVSLDSTGRGMGHTPTLYYSSPG